MLPTVFFCLSQSGLTSSLCFFSMSPAQNITHRTYIWTLWQKKKKRTDRYLVGRTPLSLSHSTVCSAPRVCRGYRCLHTSEPSVRQGGSKNQIRARWGVSKWQRRSNQPAGWSDGGYSCSSTGPPGPGAHETWTGSRSACWCPWPGLRSPIPSPCSDWDVKHIDLTEMCVPSSLVCSF